jgi:hypothetical protein
MFCASFGDQFRVHRQTCAIEGVWLMSGERVIPEPNANPPIYFSTEAALARKYDGSWTQQLNLKSGLRSKIRIAKAQPAQGM